MKKSSKQSKPSKPKTLPKRIQKPLRAEPPEPGIRQHKENVGRMILLHDPIRSGTFVGSVLLGNGDGVRSLGEKEALASWKGVDNAGVSLLKHAMMQVDKLNLARMEVGDQGVFRVPNFNIKMIGLEKEREFTLQIPTLTDQELIALESPKKFVLLKAENFKRIFEYVTAAQYMEFTNSAPYGINNLHDFFWYGLHHSETGMCALNAAIVELQHFVVRAQYFALSSPNHTLFYKWITTPPPPPQQASNSKADEANNRSRKEAKEPERLLQTVERLNGYSQRMITATENGMAAVKEAMGQKTAKTSLIEHKEESVKEMGKQLDGFLRDLLKKPAFNRSAAKFINAVASPDLHNVTSLKTEHAEKLNFDAVKFLCNDTKIIRRTNVKKGGFSINQFMP